MDKIRITDHQVFSLTACFMCGTAILVMSSLATNYAKQDAWISMLLTLLFGIIDVGLLRFFWSRYPGMTLIGMIRNIFGKWAGSIIVSCFIFFCLLTDSQVIWYIGNFMTSEATPETPDFFINMFFIAAIIIALLYGLESIARSYEIFLLFVSILFITSIILVLPNARIENLLPVLEKGVAPVFKGSALLSSFSVFPAVILLMIFPANADNTVKAKRSFLKGYLWGGFLVFTSIVAAIIVLGSDISAKTQYPMYLLAKEINLGTIFTRFEFIVAAVWIVTVLSRGILYFYAGAVGIAQLIGLKEYKMIVLPLGFIILVMSKVVYADVNYQSNWDTYVWPLFSLTFGFLLPLFMVLGYYIKNKD